MLLVYLIIGGGWLYWFYKHYRRFPDFFETVGVIMLWPTIPTWFFLRFLWS